MSKFVSWAAFAAALIALGSCSSRPGYVYRCNPTDPPLKMGAPTYRGPHGTSVKFYKLLDASCNQNERELNEAFSRTFGRLLPPGKLPEDKEAHKVKLRALAEAMRQKMEHPDPKIPAGMIFLGQFIDHDITLDVTSQLGEVADPSELQNVRTPRLDLDSVYLHGREASPYLYDKDGAFLTEKNQDFRRVHNGSSDVALIGDPRNDENGLIAQLHLLFQRFHNAVLARDAGGDFHRAERLVQRHYQWIVRHEFLPAIVSAEALAWAESCAAHDSHHPAGFWGWFSRSHAVPDMPVEFSVAAYRFGHSQIRNSYDFGGGRIIDLFKPPVPGSLSSFGKVAPNIVTDWNLFFGHPANPASKIDTQIAEEVYMLPFATANTDDAILPLRNLIRGDLTFVLPSGEAAARYFGVEPLAEDCAPIAIVRGEKVGLKETPLWYYILAEAEVGDGKLGAVGGRIVALTFLRMLHRDQNSFVNQEGWKPSLGGMGDFKMKDLIHYVQGD